MNERVMRKTAGGSFGSLSCLLFLTFVVFAEEAWT
jgi:hypothetical protein